MSASDKLKKILVCIGISLIFLVAVALIVAWLWAGRISLGRAEYCSMLAVAGAPIDCVGAK
jgi:hypothetical protein